MALASRTAGSGQRVVRVWGVVAVLLLGLVGPGLTRAGANGLSGDERQVLELLNDRREDAGVAALPLHDELMAAARSWAAEVARRSEISHSDPPPGTYWRWSENVGVGSDAASIQRGFNESASHDETTVDDGWTHVGVGAVWSDGHLYVVQQFGTYDQGSASPPPTAPPATSPPPAPPVTSPPPAPATPPAPIAEAVVLPTPTVEAPPPPVVEEPTTRQLRPLPPAGAIDALAGLRRLDAAAIES